MCMCLSLCADSFVTLGRCFFSRSFQGQLIWAKFAFDALSSKDGLWTPAEMEAALPSGKDGVYRHIMTVLQVRASFIFRGQPAMPSGKDGVYRHVMTVLQVRKI